MKHQRRHEILWELIDTMFTKIEYWNEDPVLEPLTDDEYEYMVNVISKFAQSRNIHNHIRIK